MALKLLLPHTEGGMNTAGRTRLRREAQALARQEAEAATDQYGWSVVAWELLYGERPVVGDSVQVLALWAAAVGHHGCSLRPPLNTALGSGGFRR